MADLGWLISDAIKGFISLVQLGCGARTWSITQNVHNARVSRLTVFISSLIVAMAIGEHSPFSYGAYASVSVEFGITLLLTNTAFYVSWVLANASQKASHITSGGNFHKILMPVLFVGIIIINICQVISYVGIMATDDMKWSLARITAAGLTITIGGGTWLFSAIRLRNALLKSRKEIREEDPNQVRRISIFTADKDTTASKNPPGDSKGSTGNRCSNHKDVSPNRTPSKSEKRQSDSKIKPVDNSEELKVTLVIPPQTPVRIQVHSPLQQRMKSQGRNSRSPRASRKTKGEIVNSNEDSEPFSSTPNHSLRPMSKIPDDSLHIRQHVISEPPPPSYNDSVVIAEARATHTTNFDKVSRNDSNRSNETTGRIFHRGEEGVKKNQRQSLVSHVKTCINESRTSCTCVEGNSLRLSSSTDPGLAKCSKVDSSCQEHKALRPSDAELSRFSTCSVEFKNETKMLGQESTFAESLPNLADSKPQKRHFLHMRQSSMQSLDSMLPHRRFSSPNYHPYTPRSDNSRDRNSPNLTPTFTARRSISHFELESRNEKIKIPPLILSSRNAQPRPSRTELNAGTLVDDREMAILNKLFYFITFYLIIVLPVTALLAYSVYESNKNRSFRATYNNNRAKYDPIRDALNYVPLVTNAAFQLYSRVRIRKRNRSDENRRSKFLVTPNNRASHINSRVLSPNKKSHNNNSSKTKKKNNKSISRFLSILD
eukprot:jgi/Bigna1/66628/fgenesh1_pg.2_\